MNISKLLSKISTEIIWMRDQIDAMPDKRYREKYNKIIRRINNSYNYLRKEILTTDIEHDFFRKIQIQKDINSILKEFKDDNKGIDLKLLMINKNINKLTVKYNIQSRRNETSNVISIKYDLLDNQYYVNGKCQIYNPARLRTPEQKEGYLRAVLNKPADFDKIFDKYNSKDNRALKYCDPYIIGILANKDIKLAREYVERMTKQKKYESRNYDIVYDIRGLRAIPENTISKKEREYIKKTVNHIRGASTILEDKRKMPWYVAIPVAGAMAISAISGGIVALGQGNIKDKSNSMESNSYTDSTELETNNNEKQVFNLANDYETVSMDDSEITAEITPSIIEEATENEYDTFSQYLDQQEKCAVESNIDEEKNISEKEAQLIINIGDKINVEEGLKYTADCLGGGNCNKIGAVSWRPATEYSVDRIAFIHEGKILKIMNAGDMDARQTLIKIAEENGIGTDEISTSVLLSLVPGTGDTGWAYISISDMQNSLSKPVKQVISNENKKNEYDYSR